MYLAIYFVSAVFFLSSSVLIHELAHLLIMKKRGLPVLAVEFGKKQEKKIVLCFCHNNFFAGTLFKFHSIFFLRGFVSTNLKAKTMKLNYDDMMLIWGAGILVGLYSIWIAIVLNGIFQPNTFGFKAILLIITAMIIDYRWYFSKIVCSNILPILVLISRLFSLIVSRIFLILADKYFSFFVYLIIIVAISYDINLGLETYIQKFLLSQNQFSTESLFFLFVFCTSLSIFASLSDKNGDGSNLLYFFSGKIRNKAKKIPVLCKAVYFLWE